VLVRGDDRLIRWWWEREHSRLWVCTLPDFTGIFRTFLQAQWAQLVCEQIQ